MTADLLVPPAEELLTAWEHGLSAETARAELLLGVLGIADSDRLPLGRRNLLLLQARLTLFGAVAEVVAPCADCGEQLEADLSVADLLSGLPAPSDDPVTVRSRGYAVRLRLPTAADLVALPQEVDAAVREILARCVVEARRGQGPVDPGRLPAGVVARADEALAAADPAAVLDVALECPACGAGAQLALDPVRLLWSEVDAWAWRLLAEVHVLATAYGWAEADVLELSPTRRHAYLHVCGAGEAGA